MDKEKLTVSQILQFAGLLISLGVQVIEDRAKAEVMSVDEVLADADSNWQKAKTEAEDLLNQK